ncbi:uncharacterized protein LOC131223237 [Magnolia sinica]|uniref:uncharacterized protein LOC131223237 n=1 Tax=Magnolia sinica TaxID=86752 RepID=UPI00265ADDD9|nr:uncharacterized protein LOC131223237 [Magnolia sinica]
MPKERRDRSLSFDRSRVSPFSCSSSSVRRSTSRNPPEAAEDVKEWEEARCPVCMEHPHNAVLLLCSSHDKGCRPYMCDTSYRHSNCLDQFRKAFTEPKSTPTVEESPLVSTITDTTSPEEQNMEPHHEGEEHALHSMPCECSEQLKLSCPLCRGQINGWKPVESARRFMNAKTRSCAQESCTFSGTYADLRKHARLEHPMARPSEVDPERQRDWRRLERQRDLGDVLSTFQSAFGEERDEESLYDGNWLTVFLLIRVFPSGSNTRTSWSVPSRFRGLSRSRRRTTLWGDSYDGEPARDDDSVSEGVTASWRRHERSQRRTTPDDDDDDEQ